MSANYSFKKWALAISRKLFSGNKKNVPTLSGSDANQLKKNDRPVKKLLIPQFPEEKVHPQASKTLSEFTIF